MADREVDGPVWMVLGHAWDLCVRSWAALGAYVGGLGRSWDLCWRSWAVLGPLRAVLGRSWSLYRRSWLHLGGSWGLCWRSWAALGPLLSVLERSWRRCVRSCAALGAYLGGLGRSWGLSWRSWAALGAYVGGLRLKNAKSMPTLKMCVFLERERDLRPGGGLGPLLGLMLAVLGRSWGLVRGPGPSWDLCWRS